MGELLYVHHYDNLPNKKINLTLKNKNKLNFGSHIKARLGYALQNEDLPEYTTPTFDPYSDKDGTIEATTENSIEYS